MQVPTFLSCTSLLKYLATFSKEISGLSHNDVVRAAGRRVMRRDSSRWTHAFLLVHVERTNVYTIYARTVEEKAKWMEAFKEAFHNAHLNDVNGHDLHLSTYDKPTTCDVCFLLLKGLFYQVKQIWLRCFFINIVC